MPYATKGKISQDFIEGGIEITAEQYLEALNGMLEGKEIRVESGGFTLHTQEEEPSTPVVDQTENIPANISSKRYEVEVGGIAVGGISVGTDDRSKLLINGAAFEATINPSYVMQWKTDKGFVTLTGEQVISIARAVRAHVQACFDKEADLLVHLTRGTFTNDMLDEGWPENTYDKDHGGQDVHAD